MANNFSTAIERTLAMYKPEDGEYIDLAAMTHVFPMTNHRWWQSTLLGCGTAGRTQQVKRLPLRGRRLASAGKPRTVVLVDSLRTWLAHYNPAQDRQVEEIIDELRKVSKRMAQKRRRIALEDRIKNPLGAPAKKHGEKTPSAHPLEKLDFSAMRAWG